MNVGFPTFFSKSLVKIKNPLIPPKNFKKYFSRQNNEIYQFSIKNSKKIKESKKNHKTKKIVTWNRATELRTSE